MTVCVIGNSHIKCIDEALDTEGSARSVKHVLYPCAGAGPEVEDGELKPRTERDRSAVAAALRARDLRESSRFTATRLRLADQEAFVIVPWAFRPI